MSASNLGPGRPPGKSAATLALEQEIVFARTKYGQTAKAIAEVNKLSLSRIYAILNAAGVDPDSDVDQPPDVAAEDQPARPPRRLSRRTAQYRAWELTQQRPVGALGLAANGFWIRIIVAIHEEGDGFRLRLGDVGCRFQEHGDLADLFHWRQPEPLDIDGWLKELVQRGRLLDLGGGDIGIPGGLGLVPGENARGEPMKPRVPKKPPASDQAPLRFRPMVVTGGRPDSTEIPLSDSTKTPIKVESDSTEIADSIPPKSPISVESVARAHAATAAANAKDIHHLAAAVASECRAGDSTKTPIKVESDSTEIAACDSTEITSQRSDLAVLTDQLVAMARLGRPANPDDLGLLAAWLDQGFSPETMRAVIEVKLGQRNGKPPTGLRYFDGAMQDTRKATMSHRSSRADSPARPQPPPPDPEPDPSSFIGETPEAQWARVQRALGKGISRNWLGKATIIGLESGELTIALPTEFIRDHVRKNYGDRLTTLWRAENPDIARVELSFAEAEHQSPSG
jgi:hypothetical protein